jgi:hypothetical protein
MSREERLDKKSKKEYGKNKEIEDFLSINLYKTEMKLAGFCEHSN